MHMADSDNLNGATAFSTIHEPEPTQADLLDLEPHKGPLQL